LNPEYRSSVKQFSRFLVENQPDFWGSAHKAIFVRNCGDDTVSMFGPEERAIAKYGCHYFRENVDLRSCDFSRYLDVLAHTLVENDVVINPKAEMALRCKLAKVLFSFREEKGLPGYLWVLVLRFIHVADSFYDDEREAVRHTRQCLVM